LGRRGEYDAGSVLSASRACGPVTEGLITQVCREDRLVTVVPQAALQRPRSPFWRSRRELVTKMTLAGVPKGTDGAGFAKRFNIKN
jgi:hypothetical protein